MWIPHLRRLASATGALGLALTASVAHGQLGTSPAGPPVTRPETNRNNPAAGTPKSTQDVLPGVPATARDPAPPGTRAVRVDLPNVANQGGTGLGDSASRGLRIYTAEGVVTRIDRPGKALSGELQRFAFDPSQDWFSYASRGAAGASKLTEDRPATDAAIKEANARRREDAPDKPRLMEMTITRQTYVAAMPRTGDGIDLVGAATSAAGQNSASFANVKEGSYVCVRYRRGGDVNEVVNLTMINLPTSASAGDRVGSGLPGGTAQPAGRTPTVPLNPVGAALPK